MRISAFWIGALVFLAAIAALGRLPLADFYILLLGAVLQLMILGTAWNILGGYCGYVNFGSSAFIAAGAYTSALLAKTLAWPLPGQILAGALVAGMLGLLIGVMTIRLRGIHFAIATFALAVILETCVNNWDYMGGSRGAMIVPPDYRSLVGNYLRVLLLATAALLVIAVATARYIQISWIGLGLRAIRDDELAAQSTGVPALRLKLAATCVSGGLMGASGSMAPLYINFIEPASLFNLDSAMLPIAVALIGGTGHWWGPLIGAVLFGGIRQVVAVSIGSDVNTLIVGVLLILFVIAAPGGIIGPIIRMLQARRPS